MGGVSHLRGSPIVLALLRTATQQRHPGRRPATGIPGLITGNHIKEDAILLDVGIAPTPDGIKGDVDKASVLGKAAKLSPVPGGVGPVTIASSIYNIVQILEKSMNQK